MRTRCSFSPPQSKSSSRRVSQSSRVHAQRLVSVHHAVRVQARRTLVHSRLSSHSIPANHTSLGRLVCLLTPSLPPSDHRIVPVSLDYVVSFVCPALYPLTLCTRSIDVTFVTAQLVSAQAPCSLSCPLVNLEDFEARHQSSSLPLLLTTGIWRLDVWSC